MNVINFQTNSSSVSSNARNAVENLPHLTPKVACAPRVSKEEGSTTGSGSLVSYPNPATSDLVITHDLTDESDLEMGIYNSQGKQIYQRKLALGETKLHLDAASWPRGVYFVFLRSEGKMQINGKIVLL